jgi:N-acetylmuramoyl-L-alanine amidase
VIRREVLPDALRFTLELEREVAFYDQRLDGPPRVFVDLHNTRVADQLRDATIPYLDDIVKQLRIGRQADGRTRVVLDLTTSARHSVYALYSPYRIVVDLQRPRTVSPSAAPPTPIVASTPKGTVATTVPPAVPSANISGGYSLSRQLGLGVARIAIDPGHGGHDPGAKIRGLTEADLVLDVALRLEKLLTKQEGVEVVLTRRENTFLSLEERTAIANQSGADLFLSIHANASDIPTAGGIETYFLNFAQNKETEAIAARENAGSSKSMHELPDIVRTIALSNKLDESRDFARIVQASLYDRLRKTNKQVKNLGVKQAPFMVLIGATMPSILSEIAFMTNRQEATLIKTEKYRQQIAEALQAGILRYQESLKRTAVTSAR